MSTTEKILEKFNAKKFLNYHIKNNFWFFLLSMSFYIIEVACYISGSVENLNKYLDMPEYEVYTITDNDGNSYETVAVNGSYKDCGKYEHPHQVRDFVNDLRTFSKDFFIAMFYVYLGCWIICTIVEMYKRIKKFRDNKKKPKLNSLIEESGSELVQVESEKSESTSVFIGFVIFSVFVLIPLVKVILLGMIFPIICVRYDDCISVKKDNEFILLFSFFICCVVGFYLVSSLCLFIIQLILPGKLTCLILVICLFTGQIFSILLLIFWWIPLFILFLGSEEPKKKDKGGEACGRCFLALLSFCCSFPWYFM
jgi:hypothetical protein